MSDPETPLRATSSSGTWGAIALPLAAAAVSLLVLLVPRLIDPTTLGEAGEVQRRLWESAETLARARNVAGNNPEAEREIAKLDSQLDEVDRILGWSVEHAMPELRRHLAAVGAVPRTIDGPELVERGRWTEVRVSVEARPGRTPWLHAIDGILNLSRLIHVRGVTVRDPADPDARFTLELAFFVRPRHPVLDAPPTAP